MVNSFFFFQAEDGIRDADVTGVQTCALPISFPRMHLPREQEKGDDQFEREPCPESRPGHGPGQFNGGDAFNGMGHALGSLHSRNSRLRIAETVRTRIPIVTTVQDRSAIGRLKILRSGLRSMKGSAARSNKNAPGMATPATNWPSSPEKTFNRSV